MHAGTGTVLVRSIALHELNELTTKEELERGDKGVQLCRRVLRPINGAFDLCGEVRAGISEGMNGGREEAQSHAVPCGLSM